MPASGAWYVYIVECADGSLYTGVTKDPKRRLEEHKAGGCRYTRSRNALRMLRSRRCKTKVDAYRYEWRLKRATRAQKQAWCARTWQPSAARTKAAGSRSAGAG
jgi:putative endonuclease